MLYKSDKGSLLFEFLLVITIISIIGGSVIRATGLSIENNRHQITRNKLDIIEDKIQYFINNFHRLPCPADYKTQYYDKSFGEEAISYGVCDISKVIPSINYAPNNTIAGDIVKGVVPIKELSLHPDFAIDGWGNKISYIVDTNLVNSINFIKNVDNEGRIFIYGDYNTNNTPSNNNAAYAIISHGATGHGAWQKNSLLQKNINTANTQRDKFNANSINSASIGFIPALIDMPFNYSIINNKNSIFDDIIRFKSKDNLKYLYGMHGNIISYNNISDSSNIFILPKISSLQLVDENNNYTALNSNNSMNSLYISGIYNLGDTGEFVNMQYCKQRFKNGLRSLVCSESIEKICNFPVINAGSKVKICISYYAKKDFVVNGYNYKENNVLKTAPLSSTVICLYEEKQCFY